MPMKFIPEPRSLNGTVGDLPYWDVSVEGSQFLREVLFLLDHDLQIPGVLVYEQNKLVGLIPREQIYEKLGRPFGVELFLKNTSKEFYRIFPQSWGRAKRKERVNFEAC